MSWGRCTRIRVVKGASPVGMAEWCTELSVVSAGRKAVAVPETNHSSRVQPKDPRSRTRAPTSHGPRPPAAGRTCKGIMGAFLARHTRPTHAGPGLAGDAQRLG